MMNTKRYGLILILMLLILFVSCAPDKEEAISISRPLGTEQISPAASFFPTVELEKSDYSCPKHLSSDECRSLRSLELIDEYPLYSMHYWGPNELISTTESDDKVEIEEAPWGCSLFAAFADPDSILYGRNFDWRFSPAVLLFSHPEGAYNSVSMVDYKYLGYSGHEDLTTLPVESLENLLKASQLPFDGMNERGLVIGMAAVPPGQPKPDPNKETVDSLQIMRQVLDRAKDIEEALVIFDEYNVDMGGGPPVHYLLADSSGHSVLIEFSGGEMVLLANDGSWQGATNFLNSPVADNPEGHCWRYDSIATRLNADEGNINAASAFELLEEASQANTQWSIVYGMNDLDISVAMGRDFDIIHQFELEAD